MEYFAWNSMEYPWKISHGIPRDIKPGLLFCRIADLLLLREFVILSTRIQLTADLTSRWAAGPTIIRTIMTSRTWWLRWELE